eukprot:scaffold16857_cov52-Phaeocystis_antarctica.AAC.1
MVVRAEGGAEAEAEAEAEVVAEAEGEAEVEVEAEAEVVVVLVEAEVEAEVEAAEAGLRCVRRGRSQRVRRCYTRMARTVAWPKCPGSQPPVRPPTAQEGQPLAQGYPLCAIGERPHREGAGAVLRRRACAHADSPISPPLTIPGKVAPSSCAPTVSSSLARTHASPSR